MRVQNAPAVRFKNSWRENGVESRHRDDVYLVAFERFEHFLGVCFAVKIFAEIGAKHELGRHVFFFRDDVNAAARAVGEHEVNRQAVV